MSQSLNTLLLSFCLTIVIQIHVFLSTMDDLLEKMSHLEVESVRQRNGNIVGAARKMENLHLFAPFQKSFLKLSDNLERIRLVRGHESFRKMTAYLLNKSQSPPERKDITQAVKHRTNGNKFFVNGRYTEAFALYTEAIRYAPVVDDNVKKLEELPLAFGNRSATFFQLGQYENALKDIEAALASGFARYKPVTKLMFRKCDCLLRLGRSHEASDVLNAAKPDDHESSDYVRWQELHQQIDQSLKENYQKNINESISLKDVQSVVKILSEKGRFQSQSKLSSLSTKVAIHYDYQNGHHLVTTEPIHFGHILAVTKPFACLLSEEQEQDFCHHCLLPFEFHENSARSLPRCIPCSYCTRVQYCSEQCRTDSWQLYHQFECSMLWFMNQYLSYSRLALRTVLTAGLKQIRDVSHKYAQIANDSSSRSNAELSDPIDYEHVHREKVHPMLGPPLDTEILIKYTLNACFLALCAKITSFLKGSSNETKKEEELLALEILRQTIQIHQNHCNLIKSDTIELSHLEDSNRRFESFDTLDPWIRMVKYSCDPNVSIIPVDRDGRSSSVHLFFANRTIPVGSTLTTMLPGYGSWVRTRLLPYELARIQKEECLQRGGELCSCAKFEVEQCDNPFGEIDYYPIACGKCGDGRSSLVTRKSTSDSYQCTNCKRSVTVSEMKKYYHTLEKLNAQAHLLSAPIENASTTDVSLPDFYSNLRKLESLINDKICPLLYRGSWRLASLFDDLSRFYIGYASVSDNFGPNIRKAWHYAEQCVTTFEYYDSSHYSLLVFKEMLKIVRKFGSIFEKEDFVNYFKNNSIDGKVDDGADLAERFRVIKLRVHKMNYLYKFV